MITEDNILIMQVFPIECTNRIPHIGDFSKNGCIFVNFTYCFDCRTDESIIFRYILFGRIDFRFIHQIVPEYIFSPRSGPFYHKNPTANKFFLIFRRIKFSEIFIFRKPVMIVNTGFQTTFCSQFKIVQKSFLRFSVLTPRASVTANDTNRICSTLPRPKSSNASMTIGAPKPVRM